MGKVKFLSMFVLLSVLLSVGLLTAMAQPSPPPAQVSSSTESQLVDIAQAAVMARNQVLVSGDIEATLQSSPLSSAYSDAMQQLFADTLNKRRALANRQQFYTGYQTELTVKSLKIETTQAVMEATEYTVLNLTVDGGDPLAPKTTEYQLDHVFTFGKQEKGWTLSGDQVFDGLVPAKPDENTAPVPFSPSDPTESGSGVDHKMEAAITATINRQAVVNYAYQYWGPYDSDYNPAYRNFNNSGTQGGDCTNFISQALRNGGWTDVPGWYRSTSAWWYNWLNQTWTWINAQYWWQFAWNRPRVDHATYVNDLVAGDILQIDFDRDSYMDHSMIVTKKDGSGNIYLTYHTANTKDRAFSDIYSSYPNAWYYGWILRSSFQ